MTFSLPWKDGIIPGMTEIRTYRKEDRGALERICTITDPKHFEPEYLYTLYLHYYIEEEGDNTLVAAVDDRVVGYILSTESYDRWKRVMREKYLSSAGEKTRMDGEESIAFYSPYAGEYPAHMHIDIDPEYQRMGLGTALVDALREKLSKKNVPGLMLGVDRDNTKGVSFYRKYGFTQLDDNGCVYGLLLT